jgi:hypothetical protein
MGEQSTIFTLTDKRATGEAYCLAHHVTVEGNERRLMMLASLGYLDTFTPLLAIWHSYSRRALPAKSPPSTRLLSELPCCRRLPT